MWAAKVQLVSLTYKAMYSIISKLLSLASGDTFHILLLSAMSGTQETEDHSH